MSWWAEAWWADRAILPSSSRRAPASRPVGEAKRLVGASGGGAEAEDERALDQASETSILFRIASGHGPKIGSDFGYESSHEPERSNMSANEPNDRPEEIAPATPDPELRW